MVISRLGNPEGQCLTFMNIYYVQGIDPNILHIGILFFKKKIIFQIVAKQFSSINYIHIVV